LVGFISYYITNFAENSKYFRFGPNEDFIFISVPIDTQIDIALFSVFLEQIVTCFTIYILLNEKKFIKEHELLSENAINIIEDL